MSNLTENLRSRRRRARVMRIVNVPVRAVLSLPVPTPLGDRLMLAFITGRKTGRHYRQPLSYMRHGDTLLTPGGGRWTLNLLDERPVRLRLRGRDFTARPEVVRDRHEVESLLDAMAAANPGTARFVPLPRTDGQLDPAPLVQAIEHGFVIIRWHLEENGTRR